MKLLNFEMDLLELGVTLNTEAANRQLRAQAEGKARVILDLECVTGEGKGS